MHIGGGSNLAYTKAGRDLTAGFCKVCGCHMFTATGEAVHNGEGRRLEKEEALTELGHEMDICAVNVRMLDGADLGELRVMRRENRGKPPVFTVD